MADQNHLISLIFVPSARALTCARPIQGFVREQLLICVKLVTVSDSYGLWFYFVLSGSDATVSLLDVCRQLRAVRGGGSRSYYTAPLYPC